MLSLSDITLPANLPAEGSYEAGTVDYLQILIADGQYHQAKIAYLQDVAQRLQNTVALYAALGGGRRRSERAVRS